MPRLLHVENDPLVARALARLLRIHGYDVQTVLSYASGTLITEKFDIGLFDIDLGDGDGVELAEQLQAKNLIKTTLFFTARTDTDTAARASLLGPVISKTAEIDVVLEALRAVAAGGLPRGSTTRRAVDDEDEPTSSSGDQYATGTIKRAGQRSA
ncbi:MAG TPA: response regulator [Polyangiaceae bacterium]|jgi:DNA-binding response OmpR family regulator|nr:response regulator [Polyangiaceae bacterium]